jgi:HK97 family phage major capsid protein
LKTITQYREEIKSLKKAAGDISAKAIAENRDLADGEVSLKNEILDKMEELEKIVAVQEREERISARLEAPANPPATKPGPTGGIVVGVDNRSKDRFASFGEQMVAVMRASVPGGTTDPRLYRAAATGLGESVPSEGGFLVQTDFSSELLNQVYESAIIASKPRRIPISGNSNATTINGFDETSRATGSRRGGVQVYWIDEADTITPSKPKFRRIELKLKKVAGLVYLTSEMMEDASVLASEANSAFVDEIGFTVDDVLVRGSGAGQPLGVLNAGCLVSVDKETGQKAGTIVTENVTKMYSRLFGSSRPNSVWYINQEIEPQLFTMSLAVGTGGVPVYMPAGGLSGQPYGTLFGRPVIPIEQCSALGTVGDIIFADYTRGYILADKGGIKTDMSIHVAFLTDQQAFRFILRIDGQPIRATVMTPYKGSASATQSHFVALATRA